MPMFEFECRTCGQRFEDLCTSSDDTANVECPGCGSLDVSRRLSSFATSGPSAGKGGSCGPRGFS